MRKLFVCLSCLSCCCLAVAQRLEPANILLFAIVQTADSNWQAQAPRFLTAFNAGGYNNQPAFFSNSELYLTVQLPRDTTQTEIYALDLVTAEFTRITTTETAAEYSPTLQPSGRRFSCVRVEEDGAQRLWSFPLDRSDNGYPVFPNLYGIGYHCWLRDTLAALFIVGENGNPHTLQIVGTKGQAPQRLAANIGRCLLATPGGQLAYVQKATEQTWFLKTYDPKKQVSTIVVKVPVGSEDFAVLPDGTYLLGSGAKLYQYKPGRHKDWKEAADLARFGVQKISRLAVSAGGKLAVVVN